jgi:hypothetical protein
MKKLRLIANTGFFIQGKKKRPEHLGPEVKLIFQSNEPEKVKVVGTDPRGRQVFCAYWRVNHEGEMKWFRSAAKTTQLDLSWFVKPMETTTLTAQRFSYGSLDCPIKFWYAVSVNGRRPGAWRSI